jgi:hypothetical protein
VPASWGRPTIRKLAGPCQRIVEGAHPIFRHIASGARVAQCWPLGAPAPPGGGIGRGRRRRRNVGEPGATRGNGNGVRGRFGSWLGHDSDQRSRNRLLARLSRGCQPAPPLLPRLSKLHQERLPRLFPHVRSRAAHKCCGLAEAHECHAIHRLKAATERAEVKCGLTREGIHDRPSGLYCRASRYRPGAPDFMSGLPS